MVSADALRVCVRRVLEVGAHADFVLCARFQLRELHLACAAAVRGPVTRVVGEQHVEVVLLLCGVTRLCCDLLKCHVVVVYEIETFDPPTGAPLHLDVKRHS